MGWLSLMTKILQWFTTTKQGWLLMLGGDSEHLVPSGRSFSSVSNCQLERLYALISQCIPILYVLYRQYILYTIVPHIICIYIIEGSLEVKLPTIWRDEKAVSREKSQKRKDQKKEDAGARKGRKVAKHCVFSWFCGSGGLKSRLAKAAGAETSGEMRDEKLHAVVARSRLRSEKVQNTSALDHFWKLRCWKSARRCGAKQI